MMNKYPYFLVDLSENLTPVADSDAYYVSHTSEVMRFIESLINGLENGKSVKIEIGIVELNDRQIEFLGEYGDEGFDANMIKALEEEETEGEQ